MTRDDLFNINAGIVKTLVESIAEHAPNVRQSAIDYCAALSIVAKFCTSLRCIVQQALGHCNVVP